MEVFLKPPLLILCLMPSVAFSQNCNECQGCCYTTINSTALCKCDQRCQEFGDCCGENSPNSTTSPPISTLISGLQFDCRTVFIDQDIPVVAENEAYLMVSACSSSSVNSEDSIIVNNCSMPTQPLPPVTDLTTGLVYRNEYCAYCNGVDQFVAWSSQLVCSEIIYNLITTSTLAMAIDTDPGLLHRECNSCSYLPPNTISDQILAPRSCIPRIESCLPRVMLEIKTNNSIEVAHYQNLVRRCQSGPLELVHSTATGIVYRNRFCAACNADKSLECWELMTRELSNIQNEVCRVSRTTQATTTELPTAMPTTPTQTTARTKTKPTENTGLDFRPRPRPLPSIPATKEGPTTEESFPIYPPAELVPPPLSYTITLSNLGNGQIAVSAMDETTSISVICSEGSVLIGTECRPTQCPEGYSSSGGRCSYMGPDFTISSGLFPNITFMNCSSTLIVLDNMTYTDFRNGTVYLEHTGQVLDIVEYDDTGRPIICLQNFTLNCTTELVALNESDYTKINNSIRDTPLEISFYNKDGRPLVCPDQINAMTINNKVNKVTSEPPGVQILTYIGCSLSVLGAIAVLLTYSIFKELQTFPGLVLMNLCIAVAAISFLFIIGGPVLQYYPLKQICTTLAIVLHFFYLSQFAWMTIFSFETTKNFHQARNLITGSKQGKYKYFIVYLTIGWIFPLLITAITTVVNFTVDGLVLYGVNSKDQISGCWINHYNSFVIVFLVPLVLSLCINFVLFIITTVILCRAYKDQLKVNKSNLLTMLRIWLAIFIITGFTWLFGFFAIFEEVMWMWYLFVIFNSSQGFSIFLTFIFTKKIWNLYKTNITRKLKEKFFKNGSMRSTARSSVENIQRNSPATTIQCKSLATQHKKVLEKSTTELISLDTL